MATSRFSGFGLVLAVLLLCVGTRTYAQFGSSYEQQAYGYFSQGDYARALTAYTAAAKQDSSSFPVQLGIGMCLKQLGRQQEALVPFQRAYALDSTRTPALLLYLADAYMFTLQYARAERAYDSFLKFADDFRDHKELARINRRKARWAAQHLADSIAFAPHNLGPRINGPADDYNAFLTADDSLLLFNSYRKHQGSEAVSNFFYSTLTDSGWAPAKQLGSPINTPLSEKEFHLTPDGFALYFGRHGYSQGMPTCDIWHSARLPNGWTEPARLPEELRSPYCDSWPSLSADGRTLYFISNREGGFGGYDIWYSIRDADGQWQAPQNLGPRLNTPGNEFDVFIHPDDHSLYFTSDYHEGFGGYDIFRSTRTDGGNWSLPQNLGYPLNTPWDEFDMFINAAGTTGYINSDRWGGHGGLDLYSFALDSLIRPQPTRWLKGVVQAIGPADTVPEARVWLLDLATGDTLRTLATGADTQGRFLTAVRSGGRYALLTLAAGYLPDSRYLHATDSLGSGWLTVLLHPHTPGAEVTLRNCFFDTGKATLRPDALPELQLLATHLRHHPAVRLEVQGHTDDVGKPEDNLRLSQARAEAVRSHLVQQGVAPQQLRARGYGHTRPQHPNTDPHARQQNRRVSLQVLEVMRN